ncbi:MAG TPA: hypothetical protein VIA62_27170 [Thermoanaerobaculia bacterium]|jgi:hypothetical protein|nr:hypothetical protein [Thermoanaerobaculia bacterium]
MQEELGSPMNPSFADDTKTQPQPDTGTKAGDRNEKVEPSKKTEELRH